MKKYQLVRYDLSLYSVEMVEHLINEFSQQYGITINGYTNHYDMFHREPTNNTLELLACMDVADEVNGYKITSKIN